jgi:hypothetical protein
VTEVVGTVRKTATVRTYTRESNDITHTVHVNVDEYGYIRMTANNLHDILIHLGFEPTKDPT